MLYLLEICVATFKRLLYISLCSSNSHTISYVLDGWPQTRSQVELLTKFRIVPVVVVELDVSDQEMLRRAELDRNSPTR